MEKDINLMIEEFKQSLINEINSVNLPPSMIYYVVKDVYEIVEKSYQNYLTKLKTDISQPQTYNQQQMVDESKE